MTLKSHVILGVVGSAVIYPILGAEKTAIFFASSFLIDCDHYLDYLWRTNAKDWSPKRMFKYYDHVTAHIHDKNMLGFSLMHTVEIFLLIYAIAFYFKLDLLLVVLTGMTYHMFFDVISLTYRKVPFVRAYSIVEFFIRKKKMIDRGLDPDGLYQKIFILSEEKNIQN